MDCRCSFKTFGIILLHFKADKMNWGSFSLNFLKWGTPTLENPGNRWKNSDFRVFLENSHPWIEYSVALKVSTLCNMHCHFNRI
jgi:hypothetical protein